MSSNQQNKFFILHKLIFWVIFPGIVPIFILATLIGSYFCIDLGSMSPYKNINVDIGCSIIDGSFLAIMIGMMFGGLPIWITLILMWLSHKSKNIWLKYIFTFPILFLFISFFSGIIFMFDKSGILFSILCISAVIGLGVYFADRKEGGESLTFTPPSKGNGNSLVANELSKIDISDIEYIHFHENGGQSYKVNLDSIKSVAVYCYQKTGKTSFSAGELSEEGDFLLQNYQSQLSEKDYNMLVTHLFNWIGTGGSFEIIRK